MNRPLPKYRALPRYIVLEPFIGRYSAGIYEGSRGVYKVVVSDLLTMQPTPDYMGIETCDLLKVEAEFETIRLCCIMDALPPSPSNPVR